MLVLAALVAGCGGGSGSGGGDGAKLTLVAYSTPREVYEQLIPAFAKTKEGSGVSFDQSYASSGEQSRAVESGLPADVVAFSLEPDVTRLVEANLVAPDWADDPHKGMVSNSVVVLAVRKGNPKGIKGWDDLVRDDVEVITPNPFTSGGARWNVMAAYGAQLEEGKSKAEAITYLRKLFHNVPVQDKSARESLQTFAGGKGDVLIAYENEAITAQQKGEELDYVIPDGTILIENPIAVVSESGSPEEAQAFVDYVRSEPAQKVFAEKGYRSILPALVDAERYPKPASLFTIEKFGGWDAVMKEFFDRETGRVADIERDLGAPLE
ncbi:MAG TPA: sulfate ABC transporter substrate-binding protein [Gaiellaceae bacterium]|nr:sulfate ABC transporter substrate-binding protein [Gaiellaceae bacterium]